MFVDSLFSRIWGEYLDRLSIHSFKKRRDIEIFLLDFFHSVSVMKLLFELPVHPPRFISSRNCNSSYHLCSNIDVDFSPSNAFASFMAKSLFDDFL